MLGEAIGSFLPSAVAVALSPIPIIGVVLVLGTPRARRLGPAFALGWILGLLVISVLVIAVVGPGSDSGADDPGIGWLDVALGVLFLALAVKEWRGRPRAGHPTELPKWMATIDAAGPPRAALLGAALAGANPKNFALTASAAASIAEAGLSSADTVIATGVFVAIGSAAVVGLVLLRLVAGERADRPLAGLKQFMTDHNAAIMIVILLVLGAKLLGDGLSGLWS